jgi:hypothetical protein
MLINPEALQLTETELFGCNLDDLHVAFYPEESPSGAIVCREPALGFAR